MEKILSELEAIGNQLKLMEENLKFLKSRKNTLDELIIELHGHLCNTSGKNHDTNLQDEDINEQILGHAKSAAGVLGFFFPRSIKGFVGVVAKLGKVNDENLSQVLSDYLGAHTMLAVVCKNYDSANALETYDNQGNIDRNAGLHGLASSIGRTVEGRFDVIGIDKLIPFFGTHIADDPQRRLDIPKPTLSSGELYPGFLGFAVNMIQIDPAYLLCLTSSGYGLRETLFYSLLSRLQVYKTRLDMMNALPCITEGAVSLDGGIIRPGGILRLGNRDEGNVRFAMESYSEKDKHMQDLRRRKEKILEDIKQEQLRRDSVVHILGQKTDEFKKLVFHS